MENFDFVIDSCPSCDGQILWKGVDLVCSNPDCEDSRTKRIAHFFKIMGSDYITETTIRNLGVSSIEEMYSMDEFDIANIEGFGMKKAEQVYYEVQKTLINTPERLLAALSIPGMGIDNAKVVMKSTTWNRLFDISEDQVGLGPKTSKKLVENIRKFKPLYDFLISCGLRFKEADKMNVLNGKVFGLTGTMPMKRDLIVKMIEAKGGVVKTVSKTTDYLVAADAGSGSTKLQKAEKYGTEILSYDDLMELLGEE